MYNKVEVIKMKKNIAILLILLISISLFGCSRDYLQNYKEAVEKTEGRKSGRERILINIENEFNEEIFPKKILKKKNYLKKKKINLFSFLKKKKNERKFYIKY